MNVYVIVKDGAVVEAYIDRVTAKAVAEGMVMGGARHVKVQECCVFDFAGVVGIRQ